MELAELLKDWPCLVKGSIRDEVLAISSNSKKINPQSIFCAKKGEKYDGCLFIEEAIQNGAVCIVVEDEQVFDQFELDTTIIWVPNILKFMAYASAAFALFPAEAIKVIAITGTNGKTTTASFTYQLLGALGWNVLCIGTNGIQMNSSPIGNQIESLTTIQPVEFHPLLKEAVHKKYDAVVIEASSQGLAQHRLDYTDIDIGVFLNIGEDHLEWHGSKENYKRAKGRLYELSNQIIVNERDPFCRSLGHMSKKKATFFGQNVKSDVYFERISIGNVSNYSIQFKEECCVVTFPFQANYLIENAVAAVSICLKLGFTLQQVKPFVESLQLPEGRYQQFTYKDDVTVIIDYAHTPDALKAFLQSLRLKRRDLSIVFSCGGNRDQFKREKMGQIASMFCEKIYLTTDNSRHESPIAINEQIIAGFYENQTYEIILNREQAIKEAITRSKNGETIVIVGKGHEKYQQIGDEVFFHSDIEVVQSIIGNNNFDISSK